MAIDLALTLEPPQAAFLARRALAGLFAGWTQDFVYRVDLIWIGCETCAGL